MSAIDAKRAKKGGRYRYQTGRKSSGSGFFVIGVVGYQVPLTRSEQRLPVRIETRLRVISDSELDLYG